MKAYYIPSGLYNMMESLFPVAYTNINTIEEYYIEVKDTSNTVIATSPKYTVGNCCDDKVRLYFLSYCGAMDAINLKKVLDEHETKSATMRFPTITPFDRSKHATSRYDVRANNTLSLWTKAYTEKERLWLNELMDSPFVLMEFLDPQSSKDYIPVVILDGKMENMKTEDRYVYELNLQVQMSHERYIIRN